MSTTEALAHELAAGRLAGTYDDRFAPVVDEFVRNFDERGEVGASLCITLDGVDGSSTCGAASPIRRRARPWERDTVSIVHSCTKGATALCAHVLAAQGRLDLEAPVAEYWPEFAGAGKETATVRMMLDHSVGVPVLRGELAPGELYDWDRMVARLEAEEPFWEPGTRHGYHMINFGWTVGELVRRASGRSLGTFFREAVAEPLGIDFWIGLPDEHEDRVAPVIPHRRARRAIRCPGSSWRWCPIARRCRRWRSPTSAGIEPEQPGGPRRRDRWRWRHHQRPRPRRHVHAAGARRRRARRPRRRRPHAARVERGEPRRDAVHRDPLRDGLHGQHGQPRPGPTPTRSSSASTPSATSVPAAASASPTRRAGWRSATR